MADQLFSRLNNGNPSPEEKTALSAKSPGPLMAAPPDSRSEYSMPAAPRME
jgi:hypothetical protein